MQEDSKLCETSVNLCERQYLDPKSMSDNCPKPLKVAQKAIVLHTTGGVKVSETSILREASAALPDACARGAGMAIPAVQKLQELQREGTLAVVFTVRASTVTDILAPHC